MKHYCTTKRNSITVKANSTKGLLRCKAMSERRCPFLEDLMIPSKICDPVQKRAQKARHFNFAAQLSALHNFEYNKTKDVIVGKGTIGTIGKSHRSEREIA